MMNFVLKTIDIKTNTAKIILDRLYLSDGDLDLKALAILLGGYNLFGRKIDIRIHRENMIVFKALIDKVKRDLLLTN